MMNTIHYAGGLLLGTFVIGKGYPWYIYLPWIIVTCFVLDMITRSHQRKIKQELKTATEDLLSIANALETDGNGAFKNTVSEIRSQYK